MVRRAIGMTSPTMVPNRITLVVSVATWPRRVERVAMEIAGQNATSEGAAHSQIAARLDLSLSSVRRLIRNRKLPVVKLNATVRVRVRDMAALIKGVLE